MKPGTILVAAMILLIHPFVSCACAATTLPEQAVAQSPDPPMRPYRTAHEPARTVLPLVVLSPVTRNAVTYLCGGNRREERIQLRQVAHRYDLMLVFDVTGSKVADVRLLVTTSSGRALLTLSCNAPILLLDLPGADRYRIRAQAGDRVLARTVSVTQATSGKLVEMR